MPNKSPKDSVKKGSNDIENNPSAESKDEKTFLLEGTESEKSKKTNNSARESYGMDDFGYKYPYEPPVSSSGEEAAEVSDNVATTEEEPFIYEPPPRGELEVQEKGAEMAIGAIFGLAACGCCLTFILLIAGGIINVIGDAENNDVDKINKLQMVGGILLVIASGTCLCACASMWMACITACVIGDGDKFEGRKNKDDNVKIKLRRLNDQFHAEPQSRRLDTVRLNVLSGIKIAKEAADKESKAKKMANLTKKKEFEKRIKKDLEDGLTTTDLKHKYRPVAFLVDFQGDTMLRSMELLRKQVSFIVHTAKPKVDRAVFILTSPGGSVSHYGLAASQLVRIRKAGIHLTVCIDTVAASGGFMMASVADEILAAPFAIVGSIGVVSQIPNFQRWLEKHDIDAYLFTSGRYKRTIDIIGEVTEEGKQKFQEQMDDIHGAFKDHVAISRPKLKDDIEDVATGEYWLGVQAKKLGLVDKIMTSDELIDNLIKEMGHDVIEIIQKKERSMLFSQLLTKINANLGSFNNRLNPNQLQNEISMPMAI